MARRPWRRWCRDGVQAVPPHTSVRTISSGAGATTNGGIVADAKTGAGTAGAITVRQS